MEVDNDETSQPIISQYWQQQKRVADPPHNYGRSRNGIPLSILDNIDTLRRGLMRELALRRLVEGRREMINSSEKFKNKLGRR